MFICSCTGPACSPLLNYVGQVEHVEHFQYLSGSVIPECGSLDTRVGADYKLMITIYDYNYAVIVGSDYDYMWKNTIMIPKNC